MPKSGSVRRLPPPVIPKVVGLKENKFRLTRSTLCDVQKLLHLPVNMYNKLLI